MAGVTGERGATARMVSCRPAEVPSGRGAVKPDEPVVLRIPQRGWRGGTNGGLALAGVGVALAREDVVRPHIERGELVAVLEEFSTPFRGFYFYYPARRQASPALRALIDQLLQLRRAR